MSLSDGTYLWRILAISHTFGKWVLTYEAVPSAECLNVTNDDTTDFEDCVFAPRTVKDLLCRSATEKFLDVLKDARVICVEIRVVL
jgi:hypothetical protein